MESPTRLVSIPSSGLLPKSSVLWLRLPATLADQVRSYQLPGVEHGREQRRPHRQGDLVRGRTASSPSTPRWRSGSRQCAQRRSSRSSEGRCATQLTPGAEPSACRDRDHVLPPPRSVRVGATPTRRRALLSVHDGAVDETSVRPAATARLWHTDYDDRRCGYEGSRHDLEADK
jgi:hypothetical protein